MGNPLRALVVEDSEDDAFLLIRHLQRGGFEVDWLRVETEETLRKALIEKSWDIVFSDFSLPHFSGLDALQVLRESGIETPAILVSGAIGEEIAVEAMRSGAQDYVLKDNLTRLIPSLERTLREAQNRQARNLAETALKESQLRLLNETRQRLEELDRLNRVSTQLRNANTSEEILLVFLLETMGAIDTVHGALLLYEEDSRQMLVALGRGEMSHYQGVRFPLNPELQKFLLEDGTVYPTAKIRNEAMPIGIVLPEQIGTLLALPLRTADAVVGMLILGHDRQAAGTEPQEFSAKDLSLAKTLADMGSNALQRAQLFEQTQQRLQRLSVLHAIDMVVSGSLSLTITLNLILDQIVSQLNISAADVLLHHEQAHSLEFYAGRGFKNERVKRTQFRLGQSLPGKVVLDRKSLSLADLQSDRILIKLHYLEDDRFESYYAVPLIVKGQIKGVLELFNHSPISEDPEMRDFLESLAAQAAIAIDNSVLFEGLKRSNLELTRAYDAIIESWARSIEYREPDLHGHSTRVMELAMRLASAMGVSESELLHIRRGSLLHDIGRIGVPEDLLLRLNNLNEEEQKVFQHHVQVSHDLLAGIDFLAPAIDIPYLSHENWDGSGYPRGLKGKDIPLAARIFAVVDGWDMHTTNRHHRPRWEQEKVVDYLREQAGKRYDPEIVQLFLRELPNLVDAAEDSNT